ncbi:hypothetical protein PPL_10894 [Heterostelium album PN500]|uniref:Ankyrin repeat protein n=1 Tax=Heterostelium pallidum (strain ATCC 26659 / Pp 5 / PN500) TaxID=670386 RepID=D3BSA2_HETP5|nr:hypothetical protein PPL_10894 [Heterostelium album PN500]EFA75839.1 hypothetical protein PPL_10894 [Heterostelium album PN500]|eukprot:XP_020427973.1 hypothetical protein PPL_10894 [Heterostelium album PN500]
MTTTTFKSILNSIVLQNKIFQSVRDIHDQLLDNNNSLRYDWYDLGCFPEQLIKFNYIERYKLIFNTLIRDKINHRNSNKNCKNNETIKKFKQLYIESYRIALTSTNLEVVEFIHKVLPHDIDNRALFSHTNRISLTLIEYFHNNWDRWFILHGSRFMDAVARCNLDIVKFLHYNRSEGCSIDAMNNAIGYGQTETVKFLYENRTEGYSDESVEFAAIEGHLEILKYLQQNRTDQFSFFDSILEDVVEQGHFQMVKWLVENTDQSISEFEISLAAKNGDCEMVRYLYENSSASTTNYALDNAAASGSLETVRYLHEIGSEGCSSRAMDRAARNHLDIVQFLHYNRTEGCTDIAMFNAAHHGRLDIVKFLNENRTEGCPSSVLELVATEGHLEVFQYLVENRKELLLPEIVAEYQTMDQFASYKDTSALQWCKDNTELSSTLTSESYNIAILAGRLSNLKWIHQNTTLPFPYDALDIACTCNESNLEIVQYLNDNGASCSTYAMDRSTNLSIISFLHFNRTEGCSYIAMENAISNGNLQRMKFFDQNRTEHRNINYQHLNDRDSFEYLSRLKLIKQYNL